MLQETNINKFIGCIEQSEEIITALFDEKAISKNKEGYYDINTSVLDFFDNEPKIANIKSLIKSAEKNIDIVLVQKEVRDNLYSLHPDYQITYMFDMLKKIPLHLFYERVAFIDSKSEILGIQDNSYFDLIGIPYGSTTISLFKQIKQKPSNQLNDIERYLSAVISNVRAFIHSIKRFCALFDISTEELNGLLTYNVFEGYFEEKPEKIKEIDIDDIVSTFIPDFIAQKHKKELTSFIKCGKTKTPIPILGTSTGLVKNIELHLTVIPKNDKSIYDLIRANFTKKGKAIPIRTINTAINGSKW